MAKSKPKKLTQAEIIDKVISDNSSRCLDDALDRRMVMVELKKALWPNRYPEKRKFSMTVEITVTDEMAFRQFMVDQHDDGDIWDRKLGDLLCDVVEPESGIGIKSKVFWSECKK